MSDSDRIADLEAQVAELTRRVDVLFQSTGAMDMEKQARGAPEISAEVQSLMARKEFKKAAKLYMKETGADMATTAAALGEMEQQYK